MKYYIQIIDENGKICERPYAIEIDIGAPDEWIKQAVEKTFNCVAQGFLQDLGTGNIDGKIRPKLLTEELGRLLP